MKRIVPLNTTKDGCHKTIYSRMGRLSWENLLGRLEHGGWDCQMTSILEIYEDDNMKEQVNHPAHYQVGGRECIDVMVEEFGVQAVIDFCKCNAFKYKWRAGLKPDNPYDQDMAKARWYENKAKELEDDNNRNTEPAEDA